MYYIREHGRRTSRARLGITYRHRARLAERAQPLERALTLESALPPGSALPLAGLSLARCACGLPCHRGSRPRAATRSRPVGSGPLPRVARRSPARPIHTIPMRTCRTPSRSCAPRTRAFTPRTRAFTPRTRA